MDETLVNSRATRIGLLSIHRQWAVYAAKEFKFRFPEFDTNLYESGWRFTLCILNCPKEKLFELQKIFERDIRPITCAIHLMNKAPSEATLVKDKMSYEDELWLKGKPLPVLFVNELLSLAISNVPMGAIDYDHQHDCWLFRSSAPLSSEEKRRVKMAKKRIGLLGSIIFSVAPVSPATHGLPKKLNDLDLMTARQLSRFPQSIRELVQQDEDEWRSFLGCRSAKESVIANIPSHQNEFTCLFDVADCSDVRLSELLTIYDCVNLIPSRQDSDSLWMEKHQLSIQDLQELVRRKKVRLILPYSANQYAPDLLGAIAEVNPSSLVLSRSLASKTIMHGQQKDPLLYAPLTDKERATVLSALVGVAKNGFSKEIINGYGRLLPGQHEMFMRRGALAVLGCGVGAFLGEAFYKVRNKDARLELMICGAAIEWALGLGASYIPRNFGGYDETSNSLLIASYLGKTPFAQADPLTNRMHTIVDGLLAVSNIPPLEVAKNFRSLSAGCFRNVAKKLMDAKYDLSEVEAAVMGMNAEVTAFERRAAKLVRWKLDTVIVPTLAAPLVDSINAHLGGFASIGAGWLCGQFLDLIVPSSVKREVADAAHMLLGFATGVSLDAVIVSRSRKIIQKK